LQSLGVLPNDRQIYFINENWLNGRWCYLFRKQVAMIKVATLYKQSLRNFMEQIKKETYHVDIWNIGNQPSRERNW